MSLKKILTPIEGLFLLELTSHADPRGHFCETYNKADFESALGFELHFIQDNESLSSTGVIRGLHLQTGSHSQAKLVRCPRGRVFDVAVDLRPGSPTFLRWHGVELSESNRFAFFIPHGFAHGFLALEPSLLHYKVDKPRSPAHEASLHCRSPQLAIPWPQSTASDIMSEKDFLAPLATREMALRLALADQAPK